MICSSFSREAGHFSFRRDHPQLHVRQKFEAVGLLVDMDAGVIRSQADQEAAFRQNRALGHRRHGHEHQGVAVPLEEGACGVFRPGCIRKQEKKDEQKKRTRDRLLNFFQNHL